MNEEGSGYWNLEGNSQVEKKALTGPDTSVERH